jgi:hypothetical protein
METSKNLYILCSGDLEMNIKINRALFETLFSKIDNVAFADVKITSQNRQVDDLNQTYEDKKIYKIISINRAIDLAKLLKQDCIVLSLFSHRPKDWLIFFLARIYNTPILYINAIGTVVQVGSTKSNKFWLKLFYSLRPRIIFSKIYVVLVTFRIFQCIDTIYITEKKQKIRYEKHINYKRVKLVNSKFYDLFLQNKVPQFEEYIVFLDSMLPYHGDQIVFGYPPIDRDYYYTSLNSFFNLLEKIMKKKVIVCLHPKYDESNLKFDFPNTLAVKYQSNYYIPKAKLVLFHETSLINYALMYEKEILQLTSKKFNDFVIQNCKDWHESINCGQIEFDNSLEKAQIESMLEKQKVKSYKDYVETSLIASGLKGEVGGRQIVEDIKNHYKIK